MLCNRCKKLVENISGYFELSDSLGEATSQIWLFDYRVCKEILCDAKYRREFIHYSHLAPLVGRAIASSLKEKPDRVLLTYIPTMPDHFKARGYDHVEILAESVARNIAIPCIKALVPTHKKSQAELRKFERLSNPHFLPTRRFYNNTIVLIDDISTTGTTLKSATMALRQAGAGQILAVTLANQSHL